MVGLLLQTTEARCWQQLFNELGKEVCLKLLGKVLLILKSRTASPESLLPRLMVFCALTLALLATGCQSFTDSTVKTKSAANEAAAIGALRTVSSAQTQYSVTHDGNFGTFEQLVKAGNLDARFGGERPIIGGYALTMKVTPADSGGKPSAYVINADPQQDVAAGSTGTRHLYMDSTDSTIHTNAKQSASSADPLM